jgi:tripartite-type tricarboxylate transporter receptor subunit TctC
MKHTSWRWSVASLVLPLLVASAAVAAEANPPADYPNRPIRIIATTPPGSPPDVIARLIGERLSTALGQPVVVENKPGAIGTIGLQAVARAPADGYTFGVLAMPFILGPSLLPSMPYDQQRDLMPVSHVVWASNILVVNASSKLQSLRDVVTIGKDKPGELTYASGGNGTPAHLAAALLGLRSGAQMRHVPFRGAPEGVAAVIGGQVDMMFAAAGAALPHIKAGKLRALATSAPARLVPLPDLPTVAEQGFAGFEVRDWQGFVAPAGTPPAIVQKVAAEVRRIVSLPELKERLTAMGMDAVEQGGSEAFGALIRSETAQWSRVVREAGIRGE